MTEAASVVVVFVGVYFCMLAMLGAPPSDSDLARPCAERGRIASVSLPVTRPSDAIVVCRDGTVHRVKS